MRSGRTVSASGAPGAASAQQRFAEAVAAVNAGDWARAQHLAMHLLREIPAHPDINFIAGLAALYLEQPTLAAACLERAVRLAPERPDWLAQYARALVQDSRHDAAREAADRAIGLAPADAIVLDTLGVVYTHLGEYERAAALFDRVIALEPERASYRFNHATSLVFAGRIEEAEAELEACLALEPRYWKAHLTLSQQRRQTEDRNHVERLRQALAEADGPHARMYVALALGKELEDLERYPEAFECLAQGKAAGRSPGYRFERDAALFDAVEQAFTAAAPAEGCSNDAPIFVFGMPRTGTTLIERILSSHAEVRSAGELLDFPRVFRRASASREPALLSPDVFRRGSRDWRALGEAYVAATSRQGRGQARFTDKLPHNFLYAGYIANALPEARLVCVRRDPVDTCLSNFRQLLSPDSPFYDYSFDLLDIGRYYLRFDRLMAFWRQALPGRILEVGYEALVADQEAETRRLLDFCGLGWDPACLEFQHNSARVTTASAVQVRAPLYGTSVQRWKRYAPQLGALLALLEAGGAIAPGGDVGRG
ncbi:MAG TPA: sulfotransferase [Xanthomonadaceae bacterium]|nr:sulfotransferase [Xanthomonadaceae bacterium]